MARPRLRPRDEELDHRRCHLNTNNGATMTPGGDHPTVFGRREARTWNELMPSTTASLRAIWPGRLGAQFARFVKIAAVLLLGFASNSSGAIGIPAFASPTSVGAGFPLLAQRTLVRAAGAATANYFAAAEAVSGNTMVIGAETPNSGVSGSAYVFTKSGGVWVLSATLTAPDGNPNDRFGYSVAVDGSTIAVSAIFHDVGGSSVGAVYIFTGSGSSWTLAKELTAPSGAVDGDRFGEGLALQGNTLIVGASWHPVGSNARQGAAFVFSGSGSSWTQTQELTAADGAANDFFGFSLALSGSTLVVGAWNHKVGANSGQGAAYVYTQNGSSWNQSAELTASDGAGNTGFGIDVSVSSSTIVVGEYAFYGGSVPLPAAYVFSPQGANWVQSAELHAADEVPGDDFGSEVAVSGSTIVVGADAHQKSGGTAGGTAYVFGSTGAAWTQKRRNSPPPTRLLGTSSGIR